MVGKSICSSGVSNHKNKKYLGMYWWFECHFSPVVASVVSPPSSKKNTLKGQRWQCRCVIFLTVPYSTCNKGTIFLQVPQNLSAFIRGIFVCEDMAMPLSPCRVPRVTDGTMVVPSTDLHVYWFGALLVFWISRCFFVFINVSLCYLNWSDYFNHLLCVVGYMSDFHASLFSFQVISFVMLCAW